MSRVFAAILILLFVSDGSANSLFGSETNQLWRDLKIEGKARLINVHEDIPGLLRVAPHCRSQVKQINKLTDAYGFAAFESRTKDAQDLYEDIQSEFKKLSDKKD